MTPAKLSAASKSTLKGPAGSVGATGPIGANGHRGPEGARGPEGPKGEPGPVGPLTTELRRDLTLRGRFNVDELATASGQISGGAISFGFSVAQVPTVEKIGTTPMATCPGSVEEPRAAPGYLCLYRSTESNVASVGVTASRFGAELTVVSQLTGRFFYDGAWAVTGS